MRGTTRSNVAIGVAAVIAPTVMSAPITQRIGHFAATVDQIQVGTRGHHTSHFDFDTEIISCTNRIHTDSASFQQLRRGHSEVRALPLHVWDRYDPTRLPIAGAYVVASHWGPKGPSRRNRPRDRPTPALVELLTLARYPCTNHHHQAAVLHTAVRTDFMVRFAAVCEGLLPQ
jgi:hypothetical protein